MKVAINCLIVLFLLAGCSSDDDNRPLCSEINIQDPNDTFIDCEAPQSLCQCG
ncbi:hypothetical protein [uncultured Winogradskyella sp.]|uniref:hypothetical protein n=1 Tax=uncultured Winogradskyella sp. TaxID=395353 RepID=UPI00263663D9|nr:hypothetical protein [uncultured Winogradskyella sp.]